MEARRVIVSQISTAEVSFLLVLPAADLISVTACSFRISSELRDLSQAKQSLLASVKDLRPPPTQDELRALHQTIEGLRAGSALLVDPLATQLILFWDVLRCSSSLPQQGR